MTAQELARWIRERRRQVGLTTAELETLSGASERTIRRLQRGNAAVSVGNAAAVVQALGGRIKIEEVGYGYRGTAPEDGEA